MIAHFWKSAADIASANDDADIRDMIEDGGSGAGSLENFFYFLKPAIPRRLQIYLRRKRARGIDRSIRRGIEVLLCKPVIEHVRSSGNDLSFIWFWPQGYDLACVITHDVESARGFRQVLRLAEIDEDHGFRSAFNFVCEKYPIDDGVIKELKDRAFEIGIHGVKHDGKLFLSEKIFKERLGIMERYAREWQAVGFRSPSLLRDTKALRSLPFEWDSSMPDWDQCGPHPGGCLTVFPFFLSARTVELPVTMMQDHTVFEILEEKDDAIWKDKYAYISRLGGLVNLIVHPDYIFEHNRLDVYRRFLEHLRSQDRLWSATPCEISRWWRERDQSSLADTGRGFAVHGPAAGRASVAAWSRIAENWTRALLS
jgi:peptidoglycan/xylan/chitin deacetylase (PgdA/CDA1 family)